MLLGLNYEFFTLKAIKTKKLLTRKRFRCEFRNS